jgi:ribosomal protein S18 acetylase RimI-like enzyme
MPSEVSIRTATIGDHAKIVEVAIPLHQDHAQAVPTRFRAEGVPLPQEYIAELLVSPTSMILLSEVDGEVTGFAILKIVDAPPISILQPRRRAFVDTIAVLPEYQRRGIGKALMNAAIEWGRSNGAQDLELGVVEFNQNAIAFYEHLGLATVKRTMSMPL